MKIDIEKFWEHKRLKLVTARKHPDYPIFVWCYTPTVQYNNLWDDITIMARGLVTTEDGEVIARSFDKFFNYEQLFPEILIPNYTFTHTNDFEVFEKLDGSLIIVFWYEGQWILTTKGGFQSKQVGMAQEIFINKYRNIKLDPNYTYLFELITPENRIVVNYGDERELYLLDVIDTTTGSSKYNERTESHFQSLGFKTVKRYTTISDFHALTAQESSENREGYVVRFSNNQRIKLKFNEYKRLHALITEISTTQIWKALKEGYGVKPLLGNVPDEFYTWVKTNTKELSSKFEDIYHSSRKIVNDTKANLQVSSGGFILSDTYSYNDINTLSHNYDKEFVKQLQNFKHKDVAMMFYHNYKLEKIRDYIWDKIKPAFSTPFVVEV